MERRMEPPALHKEGKERVLMDASSDEGSRDEVERIETHSVSVQRHPLETAHGRRVMTLAPRPRPHSPTGRAEGKGRSLKESPSTHAYPIEGMGEIC